MQFKRLIIGTLLLVLLTSGFQAFHVEDASALPIPPARIDHNSVALFDQIPADYLIKAQDLTMTFMDRSVGSNINDGLSCLAANSWANSPSNCRRDYTDSTLTNWKTFATSDTNIPSSILFPGGLNRNNIEFIMGSGTWEEDLANFISLYPNYANRDIFTLQHNYLHVSAGSTIDDVYFDPNYAGTNIFDVLALETQYPDNTFVYWTSSLARTVGTQDAQSFNDQMRSWTSTNQKILLDVADIESHRPDGSACRNSQGHEVICLDYTTETEGGHLGSVSAGKIRIAKAMWVMLAQISGWVPGTTPLPTATTLPTSLPTNQPTLLPTNQPTLQPTSRPTTHPTTQPTSMPTVQPTNRPSGGRTIVINQDSVSLYDRIPVDYLRAAERIRMLFMDRSVGSNINDGLTCLSYSSWSASPSHCRRDYTNLAQGTWKTFIQTDRNIPASIQFPGNNNRSNITFTSGVGTWEQDLNTFLESYARNIQNRDIFTLQHNYLHVSSGSTIDNVYFDPNYSGSNIYDIVALESQYPNKTFVYWTTSLARTVGTQDAQDFNDQMRVFAQTNHKILLDVAAIESHRPDGSLCTNAQGYEIICTEYTTETSGGHLGSVSTGKIRIAKAMWVMLAQIAGWQP
ncbi:MAG: PT domain-containing protein [Anaerolineaceae bacterium]